ncbi:MAG: SET domain-containing protein, partial [Alcaligenes pakistanensis]
LRDIPEGTRILQYAGKRLTPEQADALFPVNPDEPFHTFFFALSNGKIVDGGQGGNDSRWINHSCAPNCEGHENADGSRVFIVAMRHIAAGEELLYDYSLVIDDEITDELKQSYRCLCGAPQCRGTMIALPPDRSQAVADEMREVAAELDAEMEQARKAPVSSKRKAAANPKTAESKKTEKDQSDQDSKPENDQEPLTEKGKKNKKDKKKEKSKEKKKEKQHAKNKDKKASKKDKEGKKEKKGRKKE